MKGLSCLECTISCSLEAELQIFRQSFERGDVTVTSRKAERFPARLPYSMRVDWVRRNVVKCGRKRRKLM